MTDMSAFVRVTRMSELREGKGRKVTVHGLDVSLWLVGGTVYAVGNVCAHNHVSALHEGVLEGLTVTCPMHGWRYALDTGLAVEGNGRVPKFAVVVQGDEVMVSTQPLV
jgi:nitrite reductase/ring-hydroxylating ferredoxin subunit